MGETIPIRQKNNKYMALFANCCALYKESKQIQIPIVNKLKHEPENLKTTEEIHQWGAI
jgi:hypothetical protein